MLSLGIRALVHDGNEARAEEEHGGHAPAQEPAEKTGEKPAGKAAKSEVLVDLGNETCPVMGGKVDGETFIEWKGLRVGFCCPGCDAGFLENPEKLLDKVKPGWREVLDAVTKANGAKGAEREKLLAGLRKEHRVIRPALPEAPAMAFVDLGNERCPVMGGKVDGRTYTFWNGLRIGHCCPGCTKPLLQDPEKLLDKAGIEWREAAKAAAFANAATGEERAKLGAALAKKHTVVERKPGLLIDLGNERCPVMGGKVDGKTVTEWNGLRIGHCCPGCRERLLASPQKLLDKAKIEWREAAKLAALILNATGEARAKLLATARKRFEVVREPSAD